MRIEVDKDILDFLKAIYFGDFSNPMEAASSRAYRDMNRTIRFNGMSSIVRMKLRQEVTDIFEKEISFLIKSGTKSQEEFDRWHYEICKLIRKAYNDSGVGLTFGQAQKWVNMTIKYLYMLEFATFENVFSYLHIPLDNYVFDIASEVLNIERPKIAWSKWDDYENKYLGYQKEIRNKITDCEPLRWEFRYWLKAARNVEE